MRVSHYWSTPANVFSLSRIGRMLRDSFKNCPAEAGVRDGPLAKYVNPRLQDDRHAAFEEYRKETLRRVDEEERQFRKIVARLRSAQDKAA
jgi:hypothetical protein